MQHTQLNFIKFTALCALLLLTGTSAKAASMAGPQRPDRLLDGGPTSACTADADYAGGTDVNGRPVVPADAAAAPVPLPDEVAVPLHSGQQPLRRGRAAPGESGYVSLDGQRLQSLLDPKPCR